MVDGAVTLEEVDALPAPADATADGEVETLRRRLLRLAFDVHDGPMQSLTAVRFGLCDLEKSLAGSGLDPSVPARMQLLADELATAEADLRTLVVALDGASAGIETLGEILGAELASFARRCTLAVEVSAPRTFRPDSRAQAATIRAFLHEGLTNVAKHAHASCAAIRVEAGDAGILLELEDDGIGFDPDRRRPTSLGLRGMRERLGLLDGTLDILTRRGGPTVLTAFVPRFRPDPAD